MTYQLRAIHHSIVVFVDRLTKMVIFAPCHDTTSGADFVQIFLDQVFGRFLACLKSLSLIIRYRIEILDSHPDSLKSFADYADSLELSKVCPLRIIRKLMGKLREPIGLSPRC